MPHGDDTAALATRCPYEADPAASEKTPNAITDFTVVTPIVLYLDMLASEHVLGISEVNPSLRQNLRPLGLVELDFNFVQRCPLSIFM